MSERCLPHHDWTTNVLTGFLCVGLVISYLPQHFRIINSKSSEGFSPWFLLLGSTSAASSMLNIVILQWGLIRCCTVISAGSCLESVAGIVQLSLQWIMFTIILVLYMIYYPPYLKFAQTAVDMHNSQPPRHVKTHVKSDDWCLSIILSWAVFLHLVVIISVSFFLLLTNPSPDPAQSSRQVSMWATFLGLTSAGLAAVQYAPQLVHTYRVKLVGALSIPMMLIQSPGAIFMVLSIVLREGTNWTTWLTYAVAGAMQGSLLIMCIIWHIRQRRMGIDDFGNPTPSVDDNSAPVFVTRGPEDSTPVQVAVEDALESDVRTEHDVDVAETRERAEEDTPLLRKAHKDENPKAARWLGWLKRRS